MTSYVPLGMRPDVPGGPARGVGMNDSAASGNPIMDPLPKLTHSGPGRYCAPLCCNPLWRALPVSIGT